MTIKASTIISDDSYGLNEELVRTSSHREAKEIQVYLKEEEPRMKITVTPCLNYGNVMKRFVPMAKS